MAGGCLSSSCGVVGSGQEQAGQRSTRIFARVLSSWVTVQDQAEEVLHSFAYVAKGYASACLAPPVVSKVTSSSGAVAYQGLCFVGTHNCQVDSVNTAAARTETSDY
jgi:hypothetical protein